MNNWRAAVGGAILAAVNPASAEQGLAVDIDITQRYMWRGLDLLDDTGALQPSVTWDAGRRWYLGAWGSFALERGNGCTEITGEICRDWDEIDFYAGVYGSLAEGSRWQADWDASLTYFWFMHQDRKADTAELALSVAFPRLIAKDGPHPYLAYFYNRGAQVEGDRGYWLIGGVEQAFDFAGRTLGFDLNLTYKNGDAGLWSYSGFTNANLRLYLSYPLGGGELIPAINLQKALADRGNAIGPEDVVWGNVMFSYSF